MALSKEALTIAEIRNHSTGDQVWGKFILMEVSHRRTKDGKEICNMRFGDKSGDIEAIVWDGTTVGEEFEEGKLVGVVANVGNYNNKPQLIVHRFKILDEDLEPYIPGPPDGIENLKERFWRIMESVKDERLLELLKRIFTADVTDLFFIMPGGRRIHHGYRGGLLEHSVSMAEMANMVARHYTKLNRDLLVTGALLHDIGKITEYEFKAMAAFTPPGKLMGHIVMGSRMVAEKIEEMRSIGIDFPQELDWMVQHILLSHHGELNFGSPVVPMCPEAFALHMIDNLDAKLFVFFSKIEDGEGEDPYFTSYDTFFQQQFFKYRP